MVKRRIVADARQGRMRLGCLQSLFPREEPSFELSAGSPENLTCKPGIAFPQEAFVKNKQTNPERELINSAHLRQWKQFGAARLVKQKASKETLENVCRAS